MLHNLRANDMPERTAEQMHEDIDHAIAHEARQIALQAKCLAIYAIWAAFFACVAVLVLVVALLHG